MSKENDFPAFAASGHPGLQHIQQDGMSMRDYFAANAMQGDWAAGDGFSTKVRDGELAERANLYYRMADAMLEARNK